MNISFYNRVSRFPPILCRLLARHSNGPVLTDEEIAARSGLEPHQVFIIGNSMTWRGIDVFTLKSFTEGCGVDFTSRLCMKRIENYLQGRTANGRRRPPAFEYLKRSPDWETRFKPMIARLRSK